MKFTESRVSSSTNGTNYIHRMSCNKCGKLIFAGEKIWFTTKPDPVYIEIPYFLCEKCKKPMEGVTNG